MTGHSPWNIEAARVVLAGFKGREGAALPMLHALQERFGYVDDDAVPLLAAALNISKADVFGVVTFYHDFKREPHSGHVLKLCRAEACQSMGCEDLVIHLEHRHGIAADETKAAGGLDVESVYCLGNCALSPAALLDGEPIGRLDFDRLDTIVRECRGILA